MRLAYISDQKFFAWGGRWFTTASFPLDALHELFPYVDEWLIYGRLYNLPMEPRDLYIIPIPPTTKVTFLGPYNMLRGFRGYAGGSVAYLSGAYKAIVSSDIVWLKLPFVASIAYLAVSAQDRIVFTQMVGDPEVAAAKRDTCIRTASALYVHLAKRIISKCKFSVFVSDYLAEKYHSPRVPWLVANESRISDDMFAPPRSAETHPTPRVLYVGRLSPEKGLTTLFAAFAILRRGTPFEAWVVGQGDQLGELTNLAIKLGIEKNVKFLGQIPWGDRLFSIMRECDALVLPSRTEGLGLVLIEAMSQRVPVVASAVGGIPEVLKDGVSGLLVPSNSVHDLASALTKVLSDRELRERLVAEGLKVARQNTLTEQTGRIARMVERLVVCRKRESGSLRG